MLEQLELSGPHLQVAVFCEKVLTESSGVVSLIRIIDRFNISGPSPEMPPSTISFTIFVALKAGFHRGKGQLKIAPMAPSKESLPAVTLPLLFEGDDERGVQVQANMTMLLTEEGLYWFDLFLEQLPITRMPLRVVYQQSPQVLTPPEK